MKRAVRLSLVAAAAAFILGCHEDKKGASPSPAGSASAASSAPTSASASESLGGERPRGPDLVMTVPPSAAAGPAPESLSDSGRALFDGARPGGALSFAPEAARPAANGTLGPTPSDGARRIPLSSAGASRPSARGAVVPPVPDDPALLRLAAERAGSSARGASPDLLGYVADQIQQGYAELYPVLSRLAWGAKPRRGSPIKSMPMRVTIHHTDGHQTMSEAATAAEVRSIQEYHMNGHGWEDIGYHFLIDGQGRVVEGRPAETLGAHTLGANSNNIGVAMMGDFDRMTPTPAQVQSLTRLVSYLAVKYRANTAEKAFLQPHQHYNDTDCPGKNMMKIFEDLRDRINREAQAMLIRESDSSGRFQPVAVVGPTSA
jgi:N-acetylmuramoyl-L-alanine amidase